MVRIVIEIIDFENLLEQNPIDNTKYCDTMNVKELSTTTNHHRNDMYPHVNFYRDENMYLAQISSHVLLLLFISQGLIMIYKNAWKT